LAVSPDATDGLVKECECFRIRREVARWLDSSVIVWPISLIALKLPEDSSSPRAIPGQDASTPTAKANYKDLRVITPILPVATY
jgi:hypothetical protein